MHSSLCNPTNWSLRGRPHAGYWDAVIRNSNWTPFEYSIRAQQSSIIRVDSPIRCPRWTVCLTSLSRESVAGFCPFDCRFLASKNRSRWGYVLVIMKRYSLLLLLWFSGDFVLTFFFVVIANDHKVIGQARHVSVAAAAASSSLLMSSNVVGQSDAAEPLFICDKCRCRVSSQSSPSSLSESAPLSSQSGSGRYKHTIRTSRKRFFSAGMPAQPKNKKELSLGRGMD